MIQVIKHQYLTIIWAVLVLYLCNMHMEDAGGASFFEGFDKLAHTGFFFTLGIFAFHGALRQGLSLRFRYVLTVIVLLVSSAFGGLIEIIQWKIFTYRSADWWDFFCDVLGACMACFAFLLLICFQKHENN